MVGNVNKTTMSSGVSQSPSQTSALVAASRVKRRRLLVAAAAAGVMMFFNMTGTIVAVDEMMDCDEESEEGRASLFSS